MSERLRRGLQSTASVMIGELILVLIGVAIAFLFLGDAWPFAFGWGADVLLYGVVAALPPMALVWLVWRDGGRRWPKVWAEFDRIVERLEPALAPMLPSLNGWGMVVLALAAGIGEEILFRGALQPLIGLLAASLVFGALHALTLGFFVFATVFGLYLGWLYEFSQGLSVPILTHAIYDVFALYLLRRVYAARRSRSPVSQAPRSDLDQTP